VKVLLKRTLVLLAVLAVLGACALTAGVLWPEELPAAPPAADLLVIENVSVVDAETGTLRPGMTVEVENGRIRRLAPAAGAGPSGLVIDGSGKFLIPGLWDMHVHLASKLSPHLHLPLVVAHGVTAVRDMADCENPFDRFLACLEDKRSWNEAVGRGELVGPRIMGVASFIVHGPSRRDEEFPSFFTPINENEARELARYAKGRGFDFLKVYDSIPRDVYLALLAEAKVQSLEVVGHRPRAVSAMEASEAGQRSLEHARLFLEECYPGAEKLRSEDRRYETADRRAMVDEHEASQCDELFAAMRDNGTWLVPTHVTRKMDAFADDRGYRDDPRLRYIHPFQRMVWSKDADGMVADDPSPEGRKAYMDFYEKGLELTGAAHRAGVPVLAGTDANDTYAFPGSGLHDELEELVKAGLTPSEALVAATVSPARYFGVEDEYGSIAEGKAADMVLLRENPLTDIRNTRSIEAVVLGGRLYGREDLDALLTGVEASVESLTLGAKLLWAFVWN
jgi:cytosine/adenosine deaminase-related metal-dependent hydrolase